jgi:hypothetical protein
MSPSNQSPCFDFLSPWISFPVLELHINGTILFCVQLLLNMMFLISFTQLHPVVFHSFFLLSSIPLCAHIKIRLGIFLLMDFWAVSV